MGGDVRLGAAAVCGVFWGLVFLWRRSLLAAVLSHAARDVAVFVIRPVS